MLTAVGRAAAARTDHGVAGVATWGDLARVARAAGAEVWFDVDLRGRVWGLYFEGVICVRRRLQPGDQKLVVAHELGHAMLGHDGARFYRRDARRWRPSGLELQASLFAWTLLLGQPPPDLDALDAQIAAGHRAGLPLDWLFSVASALTLDHPAVRGRPLLELASG